MATRGKSLFSITTIVGSFFGAILVAGAYSYYNYKFSEYKFIDFKNFVFYQKDRIFQPTAKRYLVIYYSSKVPGIEQQLSHADTSYPILAIDFYQNNRQSGKNISFLRCGTNTNLKFIQRFNIYHCPSAFIIKKVKDSLYKQDSMIHRLDETDRLGKQIIKM
jgi:hypothetical protein